MATPIREACLDECNEPNETARRVQAALDAQGGCRKKIFGARCGGKLVFDPMEVMCTCQRYRWHSYEAYESRLVCSMHCGLCTTAGTRRK
eukprot:m.196664 g.196664  ORF g.196664 m.196664 type:complete len:90 (-) comp19873_c0_seq1:433-702(-)